MTQQEPPDPPIVISTDNARGALGPLETPRGATLLPMLLASLVLVVVGIAAVYLIY